MCALSVLSGAVSAAPPNFVIILTDDQGYADLSCFGSKEIRTPNIDRMAKEGRKFTSFYVASSICTPSRAGLLTGCYPKRIQMANEGVFLLSTGRVDERVAVDHHACLRAVPEFGSPESVAIDLLVDRLSPFTAMRVVTLRAPGSRLKRRSASST